MAAWDIDPGGVNGVLAATGGIAAEFDAQATALNTAIGGAGAECSSGLVAGALAELAAAQSVQVDGVYRRTEACLAGAANATNAYVEGDLQMAANAQAAASGAPVPDMPGVGPR
jgi:hypothetical protein